MTSVLLLGFGAIGRHVAQLLSPELGSGTLSLTALVSDRAKHDGRPNHGAEVVDLPGLARLAGRADIDTSPSPRMFDGFDVIVECAGVPAAAQLGPSAIASGRPLVLTSVGALAAPEARAGLLAGPGRLHVTNGAIGGLDVLEAAAQADGLDTVEITTSKEASGLIRPWMSETEAARLRDLRPEDGPLTVFTGNPAEAIEKFPANVNIAVALAWATRGLSAGTSDADMLGASLERVQVVIQAVAGQNQSAHRIRAAGSAGGFTFDIRSTPSPENPATSGLTALSVTRTLRSVIAG
ncbi:aspartate dehydrogenase domain-containing protein [Brevibacterium linens]|uniref:aspartate dehydrogenase domain-containing protein n=1 Tax=Brevibacterium linens TaxID=1703 RepID=UPI003BF49A5B